MTVTLADKNVILISNIDNKFRRFLTSFCCFSFVGIALTSLKSVDCRKASLCCVQYPFLPASFIVSVCLWLYLGTWINRQRIKDKKMHSPLTINNVTRITRILSKCVCVPRFLKMNKSYLQGTFNVHLILDCKTRDYFILFHRRVPVA